MVQFRSGLLVQFLSAHDTEQGLVQLRSRVGSFMTHIPVHKLLYSAGYDAIDWDDYLVVEAQNKDTLESSPGNRAVNVGWVIQYEELKERNLPGLDVEEFKTQLRRLLACFDCDYESVRARIEVGNLIDVDGCIASTKSLANALVSLINYRLEDVFTIEVAHRPTPKWTSDATIRRLSQR